MISASKWGNDPGLKKLEDKLIIYYDFEQKILFSNRHIQIKTYEMYTSYLYLEKHVSDFWYMFSSIVYEKLIFYVLLPLYSYKL